VFYVAFIHHDNYACLIHIASQSSTEIITIKS